MKKDDQYELYEKARARTKQKRALFFHFILFLIGSSIFIVLNKIVKIQQDQDWFVWAIFAWLFFLLVHIANVYIMKRFFGKEWKRIQTEKLIDKHHKKLEKLEKKLEKEGVFSSHSSIEELNS